MNSTPDRDLENQYDMLRKCNCYNCNITNDNIDAKQAMAKVDEAHTQGNMHGKGKDKLQSIKVASLRLSRKWPVSSRIRKLGQPHINHKSKSKLGMAQQIHSLESKSFRVRSKAVRLT